MGSNSPNLSLNGDNLIDRFIKFDTDRNEI